MRTHGYHAASITINIINFQIGMIWSLDDTQIYFSKRKLLLPTKLYIMLSLILIRSTQQCIRTMKSGYALCSAFVTGERHCIIGNKVRFTFWHYLHCFTRNQPLNKSKWTVLFLFKFDILLINQLVRSNLKEMCSVCVYECMWLCD